MKSYLSHAMSDFASLVRGAQSEIVVTENVIRTATAKLQRERDKLSQYTAAHYALIKVAGQFEEPEEKEEVL